MEAARGDNGSVAAARTRIAYEVRRYSREAGPVGEVATQKCSSAGQNKAGDAVEVTWNRSYIHGSDSDENQAEIGSRQKETTWRRLVADGIASRDGGESEGRSTQQNPVGQSTDCGSQWLEITAGGLRRRLIYGGFRPRTAEAAYRPLTACHSYES